MTKPIVARATSWTTVILLCGKCARKMDGGYGPEQGDRLRTILRDELKATGRRRQVHLIESRCLGVCPKNSVAALNASTPDRILTVPKGTKAGAALAHLLHDAADKEELRRP